MTCHYCGMSFIDGEHAKQVFAYWTTDEWGNAEMYRDGFKPVGWAHIDC